MKCLLLLLLAAPAYADLRVAHDNDAFTDLTPPLDDTGFTTDLAVDFWRPAYGGTLGGSLFDRWVTEKLGPRREDLLELTAWYARSWDWFEASARTGPALTGDLGGRWMQNAWHSISGTGPTLDEGLAHDYPHGRAFGWLAGARAVGSLGPAYALADGQLSLGTGVSSVEGALGVRPVVRIGCVELGAHVELALDRFHVADDALALPGGYRTGWQVAWRAGVHVAWSRYVVAYEYRANEGGSGEPIGVLALTVRQAGAAPSALATRSPARRAPP